MEYSGIMLTLIAVILLIYVVLRGRYNVNTEQRHIELMARLDELKDEIRSLNRGGA
jgi:hypothetical protein